MSQPPAQEQFGKYQILERIARGGMAEIFKARMEGVGGFNRLFAIKRILPGLSQNREYVDLLVDEAKIAGLLTHANIVQILDLGQVEGQYYIAMEYVQGRDLGAVLERCRERGISLPVPHAAFVAIEVLKGLEYAHKRQIMRGNRPVPLNIVHRDVSPSNVLVSFQGEVKLTDFGIAKANVKALETLSGVIKGKFDYMSPEQAAGEAVDQRTDLFAVGVLLYEMLCGAHPFRQKGELRTIEAIRKGEYRPPSAVNPDVPYSLEVILDRALARTASDRYPTATEFKEDLTRFFHDAGFIFSASTLAAFLKGLFPEASAIRRESRVMSLREQETRPLPPRPQDPAPAAPAAPPVQAATRPPAQPPAQPPVRPQRPPLPEDEDDGPTDMPSGRQLIGQARSEMGGSPSAGARLRPPVEPPAAPRAVPVAGAPPVSASPAGAPSAAPRPRPASGVHPAPEPTRGRPASGAFSPPEPQARPPRPPTASQAVQLPPSRTAQAAAAAAQAAPPAAAPAATPAAPPAASADAGQGLPPGATRARPIPRRTRDPAPSGFFDPRVFGEEPDPLDQDTLLRRVPQDKLRSRNLAPSPEPQPAPAPAPPPPAPPPPAPAASPPVAMMAPRMSLDGARLAEGKGGTPGKGLKGDPTLPLERGPITLPGEDTEVPDAQRKAQEDQEREDEWGRDVSTLIRAPKDLARAGTRDTRRPAPTPVEVEEELELDEASVRAQAIRLPPQDQGGLVRMFITAAILGVSVPLVLAMGIGVGVLLGRGPLAPEPPPPVISPPQLTLELPEGATLTRDGEAVDRDGDRPVVLELEAGRATRLEVEGPNGLRWEERITLGADAQRTVVLVPLQPPPPQNSSRKRP